ncbi:biogenesis of lysosome-related organelles complex 1 subunit 4-like [Brevipalpus obovatus]|uniref:biogenesis of lysosome-related organelles complex 1 subunit 4-like n=1 Tax=Brevipalpus obovatus TaxID=246614 RepID=UPI003D9F5128
MTDQVITGSVSGKDGDIKELVAEISEDYAKYFFVDTSEEVAQFEDAIEQNLTHLEEFCGVLDVLRSEGIDNVDHMMTSLSSKIHHMQKIYESIDKLQAFVDLVKAQVDAVEEELEKAEKLYSSPNPVRKFLASLLPKKKSPPSDLQPKPKFSDIFRTEDHIVSNLDKSTDDNVSVSSSSSYAKKSFDSNVSEAL